MKEKKTKIVMTVGPASEDEKTLAGLFRAGVDVVRFNFSHGDLAEHSRRIKAVRRAAAKAGKPVALLQDLGGPKIRLGDFEEGEITL
ncbi:MAG TPA: pyruvate kinase, partial [Candidatus Moranbacteria bacterium]|nr:pyruvate kinase [Candidatus Moranbacteria bacterium]